MTNRRGEPSQIFNTNRWMFGRDYFTQMDRWKSEQFAYYGLITPDSIVSTVSMSPEYDSDSMKRTDVWIQTVTVT